MSPMHYQDRDAQARAIERARHWLGRLTQLAEYETVVLRQSGTTRGNRLPSGDGRRRRAQRRTM